MREMRTVDGGEKSGPKVIGALLGIVALAAGLFAYLSYRRDVQAAYDRVARVQRQKVETAQGVTEVAVRGDGPPVLMVHGAAGGVDQALQLGAEPLAAGFRIIAPSRFGYLGTPLRSRATPRQQADAFVSLLDHLDIEETAVIAYSAGGPSAAQLALHYPERVSALILVSTAMADKALSLPPRSILQRLMNSDLAFWLLTHPLRGLTQRMFVPGDYELSREEAEEVAHTVAMLLPIEPRAEGLLFDMYVTNTDPHERSATYRLEEIAVPTLVVNAVDDPAANYEDAQAMSARIPGARLVTVPEGGHLMLGQGDRVPDEIASFLHAHNRKDKSQ